jgi:hypothetical protein
MKENRLGDYEWWLEKHLDFVAHFILDRVDMYSGGIRFES